MSRIRHIGPTEFDAEIHQGQATALVEFWATYCTVCRAMEPVFEQLAEEFSGRVQVFKVDVEAHPDLADRYAVRSLPTMLFFKSGELAGRGTGLVAKQILAQHLRAIALEAPSIA